MNCCEKNVKKSQTKEGVAAAKRQADSSHANWPYFEDMRALFWGKCNLPPLFPVSPSPSKSTAMIFSLFFFDKCMSRETYAKGEEGEQRVVPPVGKPKIAVISAPPAPPRTTWYRA